MSEQLLGVGVVGLGVGEKLAGAFDAHPNCRLVALCDANGDRLKTVADRFSNVRRYSDANALIDDKDVKIVVIASYDHYHAEQILRAIQAGRHVFTEKPMCCSDAEATAIRSALARHPTLQISSNTILRMSPRFIALREEINSGAMGQLYYAEADYNYGRIHKLSHGWRGQNPSYSVMLGGGIHLIDLLLWLIQKPVVEVMGYGNAVAGHAMETNFKGNDLAVALLHFKDGEIAKVAANFGCVFPHFHRLLIYGTLATYENALPHALRYVSRDAAIPPQQIESDYPGVDKGGLVPSFVDAIIGRGQAAVGAEDIFAAISVGLAIDRSIASGRPETVNYF